MMNGKKPFGVGPVPQTTAENLFDCEAYERFVMSMEEYCHCSFRNRPCDGVLSGGVCDQIEDDRNDDCEDHEYDE